MWISGNDVVDPEVFLAFVAYFSRFFGGEEVVDKMSEHYIMFSVYRYYIDIIIIITKVLINAQYEILILNDKICISIA